MSWWIYLENKDTGKGAEVENHFEGGTYALGGTAEAELNVTYNYCKHFNFRELNNKKAKDTIILLEGLVKKLGIKKHLDYWHASEGNVGRTCNSLLNWAKQYPDYIWRVS